MKIMQDKCISLFTEIVQIYSPALEDMSMFDFLETWLKARSIPYMRESYSCPELPCEADNLWVRLPATDASKKGLFFDAHVDTVQPSKNIKPLIKGDIITSSGDTILAADDKCAVASMLVALEEIWNSKMPHGDLLFIFTSNEEIGLYGAKYVPNEVFQDINYGFALDEGGPVGTIVTAASFYYNYEIFIKGKASHAGGKPEQGVNAIKLAGEIISLIPSGRINEQTTANLAVISGGRADNIVPDEVFMKGEIRSQSQVQAENVANDIKKALETIKDRSLGVEFKLIPSFKGYSYQHDSALVQFTVKAHQEIGIEPNLISTCVGTNANVYAERNLNCLVFSVGWQEAHSTREFIRIQDLVDTTRLILKMIEIS